MIFQTSMIMVHVNLPGCKPVLIKNTSLDFCPFRKCNLSSRFISLEGILSFRGLLSATGPQFVVRSPGREHTTIIPSGKEIDETSSLAKPLLGYTYSNHLFFTRRSLICVLGWEYRFYFWVFISKLHHIGVWKPRDSCPTLGSFCHPYFRQVGGMIFAGGSAVLAVCTSKQLDVLLQRCQGGDLKIFSGFTNEIAWKRLTASKKKLWNQNSLVCAKD